MSSKPAPKSISSAFTKPCRARRSVICARTEPSFAKASFSRRLPSRATTSSTDIYLQDRWLAHPGLVVEPGLRFDWDQIVRRPLFSPRIAFAYSPPGAESTTKISGGIGLYYEHTQLEYLERAFAGVRYDTYYAADGVTPAGPTAGRTSSQTTHRLPRCERSTGA